jgi:hypothetical protein
VRNWPGGASTWMRNGPTTTQRGPSAPSLSGSTCRRSTPRSRRATRWPARRPSPPSSCSWVYATSEGEGSAREIWRLTQLHASYRRPHAEGGAHRVPAASDDRERPEGDEQEPRAEILRVANLHLLGLVTRPHRQAGSRTLRRRPRGTPARLKPRGLLRIQDQPIDSPGTDDMHRAPVHIPAA